MSYQHRDDEKSGGDFTRMDEEPEPFYLWPILRIFFGVIILGLAIAEVVLLAKLWNDEYDRLAAITFDTPTPIKYYLEDMTANQYQGSRAMCWAFATMAALEQSYYENGISKGYLDKDDQVLFSPQAYGISVLNECNEKDSSNSSINENVCHEYGKGAFANTTSGGDIAWLSYIPDLWTEIFPKNICDYQNYTVNETLCDGYDERISANDNPIRFTVNNASVAYEATTVKELLYRNKRALPMTVGVATVEWKVPCPEGGYNSTGDLTDDINTTEYSHFCTRVSNMTSHPCPPSIAKVSDDDVCYIFEEKGVTLDGEMFTNVRPKDAGDHTVTVVGWSDEQMSSHIPRRDPSDAQLPGKVVSTGAFENSNPQGIASSMGGFIVQNSWVGNSHSMQYWAGEMSTWDERYICPNPTFPRNWLPCTSVAGVTYDGQRSHLKKATSNANNVEQCATEDSYMEDLVVKLRQPYRLVCKNTTDGTTKYNCDNSMYYYLDSYTPDPNGLVTAHFYGVPQGYTEYVEYEYTLNSLTEREIADTLQPLQEHLDYLQNDADNCGYGFVPYAYLDASSSYFRWYAMQYDVTWEDSSYLSQKSSYSNYNYTLLENTQRTRVRKVFDGPLPLANGLRGGDPNATTIH